MTWFSLSIHKPPVSSLSIEGKIQHLPLLLLPTEEVIWLVARAWVAVTAGSTQPAALSARGLGAHRALALQTAGTRSSCAASQQVRLSQLSRGLDPNLHREHYLWIWNRSELVQDKLQARGSLGGRWVKSERRMWFSCCGLSGWSTNDAS